MKTAKLIAIVIVCALTQVAEARRAAKETPSPKDPAEATFAEVRSALGSVPEFMRKLPRSAVPAFWVGLRDLELSPTVLPNKVKTLIAVAVAAQIPCKYCSYADTEFAKLEGAEPQEIQEAVLMASLARFWSTIFNGQLLDEATFRKEVDAMLAGAAKGGKPGAPIAVVDGPTALRDMEQVFGFVPTFAKRVAPAALAGGWLQVKSVEMNPGTKLSGKHKELIALAVSAQIPCRYCIYFSTQCARAEGASQAEIDEALAMAASTRLWSTWLNGIQVDERGFRRDIDAIVTYVKKTASAK